MALLSSIQGEKIFICRNTPLDNNLAKCYLIRKLFLQKIFAKTGEKNDLSRY